MTAVSKTGDWSKAKKILAGGPVRLKAAIGTAIRQEAHELRREIVQGLTKQAPGGKSIEKPSPLTLETRKYKGFKGSKSLIVQGELKNAVSVVVKGDEAFIGIPKKVKSRDGELLVDVAEIQEFGSGPIVIPMTEKMRKFLFALLKDSGQESGEGTGKGVVVVQIPARPFLKPAFEAFKKDAPKCFLKRIEKLMGGLL